MELIISCGMFVSHSIMHVKMSMYLQMLDDKHRWEMMSAKGSASIAATLLFSIKLAMDQFVTHRHYMALEISAIAVLLIAYTIMTVKSL